MASQQQRSENKTHNEREMHVEKNIVPKFEDLAKAADAATGGKGSTVVAVGVTHSSGGVGGGGGQGMQRGGEVNKTGFETVHHKVRGLKIGGDDEAEKVGHVTGERRRYETHQQVPSQAGHHVAEQRYAQSKQHGAGTETTGQRQEKQAQQKPTLEEIGQYRQIAQQNSMDALQAAEERYAKAKEEAANAAAAAKESATYGLGAAATKTREAVGATTQYISEKTAPVKETAVEKAQQAKETISSGTQVATEYASEKAAQAKDTTVSTTKAVAGYVGEKAAVAKDVVVEKTCKVAEVVKDQAVVTGWSAAHKTTEIAVEATKMTGTVVGKAKDVVATAAHKAVEIAEVPVVMARDTAVDVGEKLADYTARKKAEAEKYKDEKQAQAHYNQEGAQPTFGGGIGEKIQQTAETIKDTVKDAGPKQTEGLQDRMQENMTEESGAGVLEAIGETIVEIAQQTTNFVTGTPAQVRDTVESKEM